ncbi:MAG TPA: hypothetical protein VMF67_04050 [Rhizomicrobium sp.]|nr:hypothetical protein [Rhizomicrobium sp.]
MHFRTTALALGVTAALGTGAAFAQPAPQPDQGAGYQQESPSQPRLHKHHHRHSIVALLEDEMSAGRLSHKEGTLLIEKIKQLHAERRAERQARFSGEGAPPAPSQMQQPH